MELRQLRHFVALAELSSFSRAAERMHIAQPALSISIRNLEREIGVLLFDRGPRHVLLTAEGEEALRAARGALAQAEEVARIATSTKETGVLRVSFVGSAAYQILPRFVPAFRRLHPKIELELSEGPSLEVINRVKENVVEAGIVRHPVMQSTGLEIRVLSREPLVAALPRGHALIKKTRVRLADLAGEDFIQYSHTHAPTMNAIISLGCQKAGFEPKVSQEAIQIQTILSLVECGLGVALVPASTPSASWQRVCFKSLADAQSLLTVGLALVFDPESKNPRLPNLVEVMVGLSKAVSKIPKGAT